MGAISWVDDVVLGRATSDVASFVCPAFSTPTTALAITVWGPGVTVTSPPGWVEAYNGLVGPWRVVFAYFERDADLVGTTFTWTASGSVSRVGYLIHYGSARVADSAILQSTATGILAPAVTAPANGHVVVAGA